MKIGAKPRKIWNKSSELNDKYNRLNKQLSRLILLDHVWNELVGEKEKFWKLSSVQKGVLYVEVKLSVARNELIARRETLLKEINKHFDRPWITKIEIVKSLGVKSHE